MQEDEVIESKFVSRKIEQAQEKVEKHNFEIRKHLLEYDDVLNQQRKVIYDYRRDILEGEERIYELARELVIRAVQDIIAHFCPKRAITTQEADAVMERLSIMTGIALEEFQGAGLNTHNSDELQKDVIDFLLKKYALYRKEQKQEVLQEAEKWLMLETIDQAWKQHMLNLDHLKEGIGLRGWGQKNPLIEYKREAFATFQDMMEHVRFDIVRHIFHLSLERFNQHELEARRERELEQLSMLSGAVASEGKEQGGGVQVHRDEPKIGRNDPCPCGSGKKYKKCCGS